jgi:hypothetical protein
MRLLTERGTEPPHPGPGAHRGRFLASVGCECVSAVLTLDQKTPRRAPDHSEKSLALRSARRRCERLRRHQWLPTVRLPER